MVHTPSDPTVEAERMLARCWPSGRIPVDPVAVATSLGIEVLLKDLPDSVSGALIGRKGQDSLILIQRSDSRNRQRFTCAHELGHYVRHSTGDKDFLDLRDTMATQGTDQEEVFANQFAANLLMPLERVKEALGKSSALWELATNFQVSPDAMRFRLKNLGLPYAEQ